MKTKFKFYLLFIGLPVIFFACQKDNKITAPQASAEFASQSVGQYFIKNDPNSTFKIPVGITNVSSLPRTVNFSITSPTGAKQGQQYTIASNSVVIPAGTAVDSITLKGLYAGYVPGRVDTLVFTITGGDAAIFKAYQTYKVVLQQYCDVVAAQMTGSYAHTQDFSGTTPSAYGSYTATVSNWVSTGPTTATANIKNLGATPDAGWGPFASTDAASNPGIVATFDWTNPASFIVKIASQPYFNDGTGISKISASGSFSSCANTINIAFVVVYAGNGKSYATNTVLKR
jgi:hypothetical protein